MEPLYRVVKPDGTREGPFNQAELDAMRADGRLGPEDRVEEEVPYPPSDARQAESVPPSAVMVPPQGYSDPPVAPARKSSMLMWVLIAVCALCVPCVFVLAAVLFPVFSQARIASRQTATLNNVKQAASAALAYSLDYDDVLPPEMGSVHDAWPYLEKYAKVGEPKSLNEGHPDFLGNGDLASQATSAVPELGATMEFWDSAPWPSGVRMVAFVDGHARKLKEDEVQAALANKMLAR